MNELQSPRSREVQVEDVTPAEPLIEADDLIEEVSIDGMCGVY